MFRCSMLDVSFLLYLTSSICIESLSDTFFEECCYEC